MSADDPRDPAPDEALSPRLRDVVRAARADGPSADAIARMAARLPLPPGPSGGGSPSRSPPRPPAAPPPAGTSLGGSTLSGAALGAALGVLVSIVILARGGPAPAPPPPSAPAAAPLHADQPDQPASPVDAVTPPQPVVAAPPVAMTASAAPSSGASAAPAESEVALLKRAYDALGGGAAAAALALTDEHVARFPGGSLAQEREVLAITALVRVGRTGDARARAAQFAARYPDSPHRRRIDVVVPPEAP